MRIGAHLPGILGESIVILGFGRAFLDVLWLSHGMTLTITVSRILTS